MQGMTVSAHNLPDPSVPRPRAQSSAYTAGAGRPSASPAAHPARVLLLGAGWESMDGALAAAADSGAVIFMGPEPAYHRAVASAGDGQAPSVLLMSPDARLRASDLNGDAAAPPILRCIPGTELDAPDLYHDADDFVAVPCPPAELIKRILRLARRRQSATSQAELIRVGDITLNPATYQVTAGGRPIDLAWLEFQLLLFLMQNVGKVFTRDHLLASVWGVANIGGTRTVDVHIRRLRYKLETDHATYFRTVKNVGYGMMNPLPPPAQP